MSRTARIIAGLIVLALIVGIAVLVYIWVSGGSAAPSVALSAPTLAIATQQPTRIPTSAASTAETTSSASSTAQATTASTAQTTAAASIPANLTILTIDPSQSEVRFVTHEVLRGSPNTVTGRTNQVAGQIGVDFTNPSNSQVGEIKIDARSLATDNELRNRAIRGQILQSSQDQFEFITFAPTKIDGLPSTVTIGQAFTFRLSGNLTIRTITKPVTFDVTVTPDSQTEIKGSANATVQRSDYNLIIPNVPGVADVDEAVTLQIDFVATVATPSP